MELRKMRCYDELENLFSLNNLKITNVPSVMYFQVLFVPHTMYNFYITAI